MEKNPENRESPDNNIKALADTALVMALFETCDMAHKFKTGQAQAGSTGMFLTTLRLHDLCDEVTRRVRHDGAKAHPALSAVAAKLEKLGEHPAKNSNVLHKALKGATPSRPRPGLSPRL